MTPPFPFAKAPAPVQAEPAQVAWQDNPNRMMEQQGDYAGEAEGGAAANVRTPLLPGLGGTSGKGGISLMPKREEAGIKQGIAFFYTLGLFCVFAPGMIILVALGSDPDVGYWISHVGMLALLVPVIIVLQHLVHLRFLKIDRPVPRAFFLLAAAIPAVYYTGAGAWYMTGASYVYSGLDVNDCNAESSHRLQKAYGEALDLYHKCMLDLYQANGNQTVQERPSLQSCENWQEQKDKAHRNWKAFMMKNYVPGTVWTHEWYYLATMEANHLCAGFCQGGPVLWTPGIASVAESVGCRKFVAVKMLVVWRQGMVAMVSGIFILLSAIGLFFLLKGSLTTLGYT